MSESEFFIVVLICIGFGQTAHNFSVVKRLLRELKQESNDVTGPSSCTDDPALYSGTLPTDKLVLDEVRSDDNAVR